MNQVMRFLKRNILWGQLIVFGILAAVTKADDSLFISNGPYGIGKYVMWLLFIGFLGYTIHVSRKEHFFKSVKSINKYLWGRQIGIDLYIGLLLPLTIIFLHAGPLYFLLWLIPVLINANIFTLLYFALNYDSLVAQFIVS